MFAILRFVFLVTGLLVLVQSAFGNTLTMGSFHRTAILTQDGWPGLGCLAQTADGFLWITGTRGLTRFDGRRFTSFTPAPGEEFPDSELGNLHPAEGGGLWIGHEKGVTLLRDGHLHHFGAADGYLGTQGSFITDPDGHVWS